MSRRWMADDKPKLLYRITKDAEGDYNCTAINSYGTDWNVVTLKVQGRILTIKEKIIFNIYLIII